MVPATSHSCSQIPGVVGLGVVVVVVVVVVLVVMVIGISDAFIEEIVAVRAASSNFSIEIGVVDGVGHPVNSVVALVGHPLCIFGVTETAASPRGLCGVVIL